MKLWTLDTCAAGDFSQACQLEIDDQGAAIRHVRVCPVHAALGWDYKTVENENHRKNLAIRAITVPNNIDPAEVAWAIASDRSMTFAHPSLGAGQVTSAIASAGVDVSKKAAGNAPLG